MIVHIVIGLEGEYSDRVEHVAGVFTELKVAEDLIVEKTAIGRERAAARQLWYAERQKLIEKILAEKLAAVDEKTLAYYGKDFLPSKYTALNEEERAQINHTLGQVPAYIDYICYYVVSVPVNGWGRWGRDGKMPNAYLKLEND